MIIVNAQAPIYDTTTQKLLQDVSEGQSLRIHQIWKDSLDTVTCLFQGQKTIYHVLPYLALQKATVFFIFHHFTFVFFVVFIFTLLYFTCGQLRFFGHMFKVRFIGRQSSLMFAKKYFPRLMFVQLYNVVLVKTFLLVLRQLYNELSSNHICMLANGVICYI